MKELINGAVCKDGCKSDCIHYSTEINDCKYRCISQHINKTGPDTVQYTPRNCRNACVMDVGIWNDNYCLFGQTTIFELRDPEKCEIRKAWIETWRKADQQCLKDIEARNSKK